MGSWCCFVPLPKVFRQALICGHQTKHRVVQCLRGGIKRRITLRTVRQQNLCLRLFQFTLMVERG